MGWPRMALTVEDGTIVPGADSYVTLEAADAYLTMMNNAAWAALTAAEKEAALIRGRMLVEYEAVYRYDGDRQAFDQPLVWPRHEATMWDSGPVIPDGTIPGQIRQAQIVAAGGIADGSIVIGGTGGQHGKVKSESVDSISVTYFSPREAMEAGGAGSGPFAGIGWPPITGIVAPLLKSSYYRDRVGSETAAERGPAFTAPSYGGIWDIGQNDHVTPDAKLSEG